ncbi:MAG: hypothetical protein AAGB03_04670 [Pseudomonadota bacterium]
MGENFGDLLELVEDSFTAVNTFQGLIIAFLAALIMARYNRVLYFTLLALAFDQFLVPLGVQALDQGSIGDLVSTSMSILNNLDLRVVVLRFIGFFIVISLIFGLKRVFQRFGSR